MAMGGSRGLPRTARRAIVRRMNDAPPIARDGRDRREGGRWTRAQRLKNDALFVLATVALAVASVLPKRALAFGGVLLARIAYVLLPRARATAFANVADVFPAQSARERRALVRRTYATLGRYLGETVATLRRDRPASILPFAPGARERLAALVDEGRGVVLASAHLGPWESVASTLAGSGFPLTVVAREAYDPRFDRLYERLRDARGIRTLYRGRSGAAVGLVRALRRGDVLGIPMDLASRVPSVDVPFLGRPAPTPIGPARIALRTGAPVVVATPVPHEGGLALDVSVVRIDDPTPSDAAERLLTERINDEIGARIRAMPASWVWMHDRWRRDGCAARPPTM